MPTSLIRVSSLKVVSKKWKLIDSRAQGKSVVCWYIAVMSRVTYMFLGMCQSLVASLRWTYLCILPVLPPECPCNHDRMYSSPSFESNPSPSTAIVRKDDVPGHAQTFPISPCIASQKKHSERSKNLPTNSPSSFSRADFRGHFAKQYQTPRE